MSKRTIVLKIDDEKLSNDIDFLMKEYGIAATLVFAKFCYPVLKKEAERIRRSKKE